MAQLPKPHHQVLCSNPRVPVSNLCYLIKLLQLFPAYFIYTPFVTLSMFAALSNFRRLINLLSSSYPFLSIHFFTLSTYPINAPASALLICFHFKFSSRGTFKPVGQQRKMAVKLTFYVKCYRSVRSTNNTPPNKIPR